MRITISGTEPITSEKRAYAEYRFFTSIAPYERRIGAVDVAVRRDVVSRGPFLCVVAVDLGRAGYIRTQARAMHPTAAIDRAADRTASLIGRRFGRGTRVKSSGRPDIEVGRLAAARDAGSHRDRD